LYSYTDDYNETLFDLHEALESLSTNIYKEEANKMLELFDEIIPNFAKYQLDVKPIYRPLLVCRTMAQKFIEDLKQPTPSKSGGPDISQRIYAEEGEDRKDSTTAGETTNKSVPWSNPTKIKSITERIRLVQEERNRQDIERDKRFAEEECAKAEEECAKTKEDGFEPIEEKEEGEKAKVEDTEQNEETSEQEVTEKKKKKEEKKKEKKTPKKKRSKQESKKPKEKYTDDYDVEDEVAESAKRIVSPYETGIPGANKKSKK
jgi:hypothetical protein